MNTGISYELALKLKEAGLKQWGHSFAFKKEDGSNVLLTTLGNNIEAEKKGYMYSPSLSELIEACGDKFYALESPLDGTGYWTAKANQVGVSEMGKTPEEVVSLLWLALQNKL